MLGARFNQTAEDFVRLAGVVDADGKVLRAIASVFLPCGTDVGFEVIGYVEHAVVGLVVVFLGCGLDPEFRLECECFEIDCIAIVLSPSVVEAASCGLADGQEKADGTARGATGNFGYARGMPEGQGKIFIAP